VTDEITDAQLDEWERLCAETFPGPWEADPLGGKVTAPDDKLVALVYARDGREKRWYWECETSTTRFVAAARTAVPALVAALRRARGT
jgi:hypothetical protein